MHFADWPVWARPKDEQAGKTTPLSEVASDLAYADLSQRSAEAFARSLKQGCEAVQAATEKIRKKPGPKPKVKP